MVEFGGWEMPVQYTSIVEEHHATRNAVGIFDISHMGRLRFDGPDAAAFLDSLVTRRVDNLAPGRIRYALITNDEGGVLDDVLVYHLQDGQDTFHLMVVNASNRDKIVQWITPRLPTSVPFADQTLETAMIAIQGPRGLQLTQNVLGFDASTLKYYCGQLLKGEPAGRIISRTGYTVEDGCELIVPAADAPSLWQQLIDQGKALGAVAAGLGARDTLRLEAAMPLYGHEINESISPWQAGLDFAVDLPNRSFPGHAALERLEGDPALPCRVGLECSGRRVPREGYPIKHAGEEVGIVTSGGYSPTLEKPIAMGYVPIALSALDLELTIDVRGREEPARVVTLPFYHRQ